MKRWLRGALALILKEAKLELRGRETLTLLFCNALLASALVGIGTSSAFLDRTNTAKIFPMMLWVVFLLSVTMSVVRAYEQELEHRGFEGLLLVGATGAQMYVAKLLVSTVLFFAHFAVLMMVLAVALNQELQAQILPLCGVGCLASLALAALTVLLSAVAGTSRLRGVLLPLLALPLLFPVFFAGSEMTAQLVINGGLDASSPWPAILVCTSALFTVLGINLFEHAVRD